MFNRDPNKLMFWGLATIIALVIIYVLVALSVNHGNARRILIYTKGYNDGVEEVHRDAVKVGAAKWEIVIEDDIPRLTFVWTTLSNISTSDAPNISLPEEIQIIEDEMNRIVEDTK